MQKLESSVRKELFMFSCFFFLHFFSGFLTYLSLSVIHVSIHTANGNNTNGNGWHHYGEHCGLWKESANSVSGGRKWMDRILDCNRN